MDGITTVVVSRNRCRELLRSLPMHESPVVLVDNSSTDGTVEMVNRHFPEIDVIRLNRNHGAAARNIGVRAARTPYVAFADDDSWWAKGALAAAVDLLDRHPRLAVLAARILLGDEKRVEPLSEAMAAAPLGTEPDLPGPSILGFAACGVAVRREAFLAAGGFDDVVFFYGEEERLALDLCTAGMGLAYAPELTVHHYPSPIRDVGARRRLAVRNRILTAVMRQPWTVVARTVADGLFGPDRQPTGVLDALRRSPKAVRQRQVIPEHVQRQLALLAH